MSAVARVVSASNPRDMVVAILSRHMMLSWPRGGWWGAEKVGVVEISRATSAANRKYIKDCDTYRSEGASGGLC